MTDLATLRADRARAQAKLNTRQGQAGYGANVETIKATIQGLDEQIAEKEAEEAAAAAQDETDGEDAQGQVEPGQG